jgi:AcrR family transcriptional regulator
MRKLLEDTLGKRKADIVAATLKLADLAGMSGLTTKKIAHEVGFVEGALYKHVKSKKDLLALVFEVAEQVYFDIFKEIDKKKPQAEEALRAWFAYGIAYLEEFPGLYRILFSDELYGEYKELFDKFKAFTETIRDEFEKIIRRGIEDRVFRKVARPDLVAILYLGVVHTSFTIWNLFEGRAQQLGELAGPILEEFFDGLILKEG